MNYDIDIATIKDYNTHQQHYNARETALLIIEMQEFFRADEENKLLSDSQINNVKYLTAFATQHNMPMIFVRHHQDSATSQNMVDWWGDKIEKNSAIWQIIPELQQEVAAKNSMVIDKSQYSAFYGTDLDNMLQAKAIKNIVICGLMTNCCCETAARDGFMRGYNIIFINDATATINAELHLATIKNIAFGFGQVINTADISEILL